METNANPAPVPGVQQVLTPQMWFTMPEEEKDKYFPRGSQQRMALDKRAMEIMQPQPVQAPAPAPSCSPMPLPSWAAPASAPVPAPAPAISTNEIGFAEGFLTLPNNSYDWAKCAQGFAAAAVLGVVLLVGWKAIHS